MTKTIYLIDPETRMLIGSSPHPLDPVETERAGKPVYALLNPELATQTPPPRVPQGMRAVLVDASWSLEPIPAPPAPAPAAEAATPATTAPAPAPAAPSFEQRLAALRALVQEYMDAMARAYGYDDMKTAVTYADEPAVPKFQNEGRALRAWRSLLWEACYQLLARVQAGEIDEPTAEALPDLLPRLTVPPLASSPEATEALEASREIDAVDALDPSAPAPLDATDQAAT